MKVMVGYALSGVAIGLCGGFTGIICWWCTKDPAPFIKPENGDSGFEDGSSVSGPDGGLNPGVGEEESYLSISFEGFSGGYFSFYDFYPLVWSFIETVIMPLGLIFGFLYFSYFILSVLHIHFLREFLVYRE